jgi:hypothetical protein
MPRFARPVNTSKMSGRNSLRGFYKDSLTYNNPSRFQVKAVITLPNEADALITLSNEADALIRIISHLKEDRPIPR